MCLIVNSGLSSQGDSGQLIGGSCTQGRVLAAPSPCCHPCYFETSLTVESDDTKLDRESIIGPIYQLASLCSKNKHITEPLHALPPEIPSEHAVHRSGYTDEHVILIKGRRCTFISSFASCHYAKYNSKYNLLLCEVMVFGIWKLIRQPFSSYIHDRCIRCTCFYYSLTHP